MSRIRNGAAAPGHREHHPSWRVIARYGSSVELLGAQGETFRAQLRRRVEDVVCGDTVVLASTVQRGEQDPPASPPASAVVQQRLPRRNVLTRRDGFQRLRVMAANIDRVWLVLAPCPETPHLLIDRFLTGILNLPAQPGLLLNKSDWPDRDALDRLHRLLENYAHLEICTLSLSAALGTGFPALRVAAGGQSNLLVGPSGTGKSSILQRLLPEEHLLVGEISAGGEGRHTTTTARWYPLATGGAWIDSPGVRDFTPDLGSEQELLQGFPDLARWATACRFRNCRHQGEPQCGVRKALDNGDLPAARWQAWQELRDSIRAL